MRGFRTKSSHGFSLIELVIVVVIIGIIGAIAIPRMSRGSAGAADSALVGNLSVLRNAIDLYSVEHGGDFPTAANIEDQLTSNTNANGDVGTDATEHIYGPYLRRIPPLPVGENQGESDIIPDGSSEDGGWVYDEETGEIWANTGENETDASGTPYTEY